MKTTADLLSIFDRLQDRFLIPTGAAIGLIHAYSVLYGLWWLQILSLGTYFAILPCFSRISTALIGAFAFGLSSYGLGLLWVQNVVATYTGLSWLTGSFMTAALVALYASMLPIAVLPCVLLKTRVSGFSSGLLLAISWSCLEWLRSNLLLGGLPWLNLAYAHVDGALRGYAKIFGYEGISFFAVMTAGLVSVIARGTRGSRVFACFAVVVICAGGVGITGIAFSRPDGQSIRMLVVQPGTKLMSSRRMPESLTSYVTMPKGEHVDLVLLPESMLSEPWQKYGEPQRIAIESMAVAEGMSILVGGFVLVPGKLGHAAVSNSAIMINGRERPLFNRYDKVRLTPIGEATSAMTRQLLPMIRLPESDLLPGSSSQRALRVSGEIVGVSICFEEMFGGDIARGFADFENAPNVLVNLSNYSWFDGTSGKHQALQMARMRALEFERELVTSTTTGISAAIGWRGDVRSTLPEDGLGRFTIQVESRRGVTPYGQHGDAAFVSLAVIVTLAWLSSVAAMKAVSRRVVEG